MYPLNVGPWEMMAILAIAILLIGPKRVLEIARTIGRITSQMRRLSDEFLGTLRTEIQETEREARQALQGTGEWDQLATTSLPSELETIQREAGEAAEEIATGIEDTIKGRRADEDAT